MILPLLLGAAAALATLAGGALTLRARGRLHLVTGASGGIVLGVALLDLLPEAARVAGASVLAAAGLAFLLYLALGHALARATGQGGWLRGQLGPASLTLHSFIDGAGIGLAFQLSPHAGWGVALAVLGHDLADGVNIVGLTLGRGDPGAARRWLIANAAAPVLGAATAELLHVPPRVFATMLAALGGLFLGVALGELLPRSLRLGHARATLLAAAGGFAAIALIVLGER